MSKWPLLSGATGVVASMIILLVIPGVLAAGASAMTDRLGTMTTSSWGFTFADIAHITWGRSKGSTSSSTTMTCVT